MAIPKDEFFSAPGSCDITGKYTVGSATIIEESTNKDLLLMNKIAGILHEEFGNMPLNVSIIPQDFNRYYEVRVTYGINNNCCVCIDINRYRLMEISGSYGLQMVAEVTAERIIRHIRKGIMNNIFGSEIEERTPNEEVKKEEAFRKILI